MAEEAIKGRLLDPSSKEKDAISVASIMLKAVATTRSWKLWSVRKHALSIRDLNTLEDANYALHHFKASQKGASPLSVLEDELTCLRKIPRNAQSLTERSSEFIDNLRLVAGKQFDQAEQNSKSIRAKLFVQDVGVPLAKRLCFTKLLIKKTCLSESMAEQISTELNSVTVMEAKQIKTHLCKIEGADVGKEPTANLLFETKKPFSAQQLSGFRELEKRYVNVTSRVERLPDQTYQVFKENLLVQFGAERAGWPVLAAKTKVDD
ncbi:hypothetical protein E8E11_000854 [Didymella keratinophila]|nr:hypothetical protein E8E11_000854 [Didymella keratinophila]